MRGINSGREYVGLANYERLLKQDKRFRTAIINGAEFAIGTAFVQMPLALAVALALDSAVVRFKTMARLAFFAPYITSAIVVGWIFTLIFLKQEYGLLNGFLSQFGIPAVYWLSKDLAMPALIILGLWTWVGHHSLFFLAGLQAVPEELKEAARIDGANGWQLFRNVTMPFLRPVFIFVILTGSIGSFSLFSQPCLLFDSGSGPLDAGLFPLMYLFFMGFRDNTRLGYASAIGYLLTLIILAITAVQLLLIRMWKVWHQGAQQSFMATLTRKSGERRIYSGGHRPSRLHVAVLNGLVLFGVLLTVIPFLYMITASFRSQGELYSLPVTIFPREFIMTNYNKLFADTEFVRWYGNTVWVAGLRTSTSPPPPVTPSPGSASASRTCSSSPCWPRSSCPSTCC